MKQLMLVILLLLVMLLTTAARPVHYTYPDQDCAGQVCEIEASSKPKYSTCRYFADGYLEYLGGYDEAVGGFDADGLLAFCLVNYEYAK